MRIENIEGSAGAVKDAPDIAFLKIVLLRFGGALLDLLPHILEGVLEHQIHFVVGGADEILLLLLDLSEREEMVALNLRLFAEESLDALHIGQTGTGDHSHEVLALVRPALQQRVAVPFNPIYLELVVDFRCGFGLPHLNKII